GEARRVAAHDPLGQPVQAGFVLLNDGRAVVEVAAASGLTLVPESERDALAADTRGTGELLGAAAAAGAGEILVAAGGSATTDGVRGAVEVMRESGFDSEAHPVTVLCDARTSWEDCPRVFAPQKGADLAQVAELEQRLGKLATEMPRDPTGIELTGAAGGLSGGLWSWFGARLVSGAARVLDLLSFDQALSRADCVLTGEGRLDPSTGEGKWVAEVAGRSLEAGIPCLAVVGELALDPAEAQGLGLVGVREGGNPGEICACARQLVESVD
ncbi:MAG: glycerate kinase, partial [bacterium]